MDNRVLGSDLLNLGRRVMYKNSHDECSYTVGEMIVSVIKVGTDAGRPILGLLAPVASVEHLVE